MQIQIQLLSSSCDVNMESEVLILSKYLVLLSFLDNQIEVT